MEQAARHWQVRLGLVPAVAVVVLVVLCPSCSMFWVLHAGSAVCALSRQVSEFAALAARCVHVALLFPAGGVAVHP